MTISAENCWWVSANEAVIVDYEPWQGALSAEQMSWGEVKDAFGAQSGR